VPAQLTDNLNGSTGGAVQRFLASCISNIQQKNDRSADEANESFSNGKIDNPHEIADKKQLKTASDASCPVCPTDLVNLEPTVCCNNGKCVNSACQCKNGLLMKYIVSMILYSNKLFHVHQQNVMFDVSQASKICAPSYIAVVSCSNRHISLGK